MAGLSNPNRPIPKKIQSKFNGTLEIIFQNGKKHLNSENANYSYGALEAIMRFGLEKINLKNVNSVLLLGLGGGCIIKLLRKDFDYKKQITAVDIDPVIIDIAKTEFRIENTSVTKIICQDAFQFMNDNSTTFYLIIVDLFVDIKVPKPFVNIPFWENVVSAKTTPGCIFFNASLEVTKSDKLNTVIQFLKTKVYNLEVFEKVNNCNTVILSSSL